MKKIFGLNFVLALLIIVSTSLAQAKIDVGAQISSASSADLEATQLMNALKALGAAGTVDSTGHLTISIKGSVTEFNGAACDNGHPTYVASLEEVDQNSKTLKKMVLDGEQSCTSVSKAEKLSKLIDKWGGSSLVGYCGAGHCDTPIRSIVCTHFSADKDSNNFDVCNVVLGAAD